MPGNASLRITCVSAKLAVPIPLFVTVIVQLNDPFSGRLPLTLLDLVTVRSAIKRLTTWLSAFDVTPATMAEAIFVTEPVVTSAAVTVYVAVQVIVSLGSRKSSRSPTVITAGQLSSVALSSDTVTGPSNGANPLFVTS